MYVWLSINISILSLQEMDETEFRLLKHKNNKIKSIKITYLITKVSR